MMRVDAISTLLAMISEIIKVCNLGNQQLLSLSLRSLTYYDYIYNHTHY